MPLALLFPPSLGQITASARAELLSDWLGKRLGTWVSVEVAESYADLQRRIESGDVDLAWAPPSICARVAGKARAIFKAVRGGSSTYRGAIVVRAGEIGSLAELAGKRAAWVDELSTAGYLLPIAHLRSAGLLHEGLAAQTFLGSYGAVVRAVLEERADFCCVFVPNSDPEVVARALSTFVGNRRARALGVLDFTAAAPSDGLVITDRTDVGGNEVEIDAVARLVSGPDPTSMLLSMLDADYLEPAGAGEYDAVL